MDYQAREDDITGYIEDNFNGGLPGGERPLEHFINEFLDLEHYVYDNTLFFQFDQYEYGELTNQSKLETLNMRVFIVVRNGAEKELHRRLRNYATAFYAMFEKSGCNLGGLRTPGLLRRLTFTTRWKRIKI